MAPLIKLILQFEMPIVRVPTSNPRTQYVISHCRHLVSGNWLTSGSVLDSNSNWLCQFLWKRGITVLKLRRFQMIFTPLPLPKECANGNIVISTGGLGPTPTITRDNNCTMVAMPIGVNAD